MGDFGKILDQWEIKKDGEKDAKTGQSGFADQVDRYPVHDKDAEDHPTTGPRKSPLKQKIEDTIDLHGMTVPEAIQATDAFLEASVKRGLKKVLVIHGKGRDGDGVLRKEIRAFLERHAQTGAMGNPKGEQGGRGALWVMLRYRSR